MIFLLSHQKGWLLEGRQLFQILLTRSCAQWKYFITFCTISPLHQNIITSNNIWAIEVIDSSEVEDTTGGIQFVMPVKHPKSLWNLKKKRVQVKTTALCQTKSPKHYRKRCAIQKLLRSPKSQSISICFIFCSFFFT